MKKTLLGICMLSLVACNSTDKEITDIQEMDVNVVETIEVETIDELGEELDDKTAMNTAFYNFKEIIASGDCEKLIEMTVSPVKGDCIAMILNPENPYDLKVTEDILRDNCQILTDFEKDLLKVQTFTESAVVQELGDCVYKAKISIESGESFTWSIGCSELTNDLEAGEYLNMFKFENIDGKYKLTEIKCAG